MRISAKRTRIPPAVRLRNVGTGGARPGLKLLALAGVGAAFWLAARGRRFSFRDRTVIISGGSRGLGLAIARRLAREGAHLVLLARDRDELRRAERDPELSGIQVMTLACDVRQREEVTRAIDAAIERFGRIDALFNVAGVIQVGPLEHMSEADYRESMAVHLMGPLYAIEAVLPQMRRQGEGRIVNISSIGGKIAVPHLLPYSAGKFALAGLSEGLAAELRRDGIYVTTVYPGLMRTGSPPNAFFKGQHRAEYAWFAISDALPLLSVSASRAARAIVEVCRRGSPYLIVGNAARAAILFRNLFPRTTVRLMAIMNRILPAAGATRDKENYTGWQSQSRWAPSAITKLSDQATRANNESAEVGSAGMR